MKRIVLLVLVILAPGAVSPSGRVSPALPWLNNLDDVTATNIDDPLVAGVMEARVDPSCEAAMPAGLSLVANVAPAPGSETILASFAHGVMVYGAEGELIASTPGFPCAGSADEIEVLAAGTAFGVQTIVIAVTTGGRREQLTWLGLYRIGLNGRLEAVFAGTVEQREDGIVRRGSVTILPEALLVKDPLGGTGFWVFDPTGGIYVPRGGTTGGDHPNT